MLAVKILVAVVAVASLILNVWFFLKQRKKGVGGIQPIHDYHTLNQEEIDLLHGTDRGYGYGRVSTRLGQGEDLYVDPGVEMRLVPGTVIVNHPIPDLPPIKKRKHYIDIEKAIAEGREVPGDMTVRSRGREYHLNAPKTMPPELHEKHKHNIVIAGDEDKGTE